MNRLTPAQHGVVDLVFAATTAAAARALPVGPAARRLLLGSSLAVLGLSAVTRYPLGLVKVVPMRGHLAADALVDAAFLGAPLVYRSEAGSVRAALAAFGAAGTAATLLTRTTS